MAPLAVTAFLVGLAGGVHCVVMCGGLLAALNAAPGIAAGKNLGRQLGYGAGRIASYAGAGAVAGGAGELGLLYGRAMPVRLALLVAADALVVLLGLRLAGAGNTIGILEKAGSAVWRVIGRLGARLSPARTPLGAFAAGLVWGWIPCGLVYGILATAAVAGSAARGAAVMAAFGLGTLPNLLAAGLAAERLGRWTSDRRVRIAAGAAVVLLGLAGLARIPEVARHLRRGPHAGHGAAVFAPPSRAGGS